MPAKVARAFLASIPAHSRASMVIKHNILEKNSPIQPEITVTYSKFIFYLFAYTASN